MSTTVAAPGARPRPTPRRAAARVAGIALLLGIAAWHGGRAAWIEAKAELAQLLVRRAWEKTLAGAGDARPWPWADTHPVARLIVPRHGVDTFVLSGASGRTLAFGPGHLDGTPLPGERGNSVLSGHRDTHFAFLRRLAKGDELVLEGRDGRRRRYVVDATRVVDRRDVWVAADADDTRLTLVTCYPFYALGPGGPLRYVVVAVAASRPDRQPSASATRSARSRALTRAGARLAT